MILAAPDTRMTDTSPDLRALTFRQYGAKMIREALEKMLGLSDAVRDGDDVEAVHDMRVASRRLRAAIDVFGSAFPSKEFDRFERDVKAVTRELGAARDLDVMIQTLAKMELTLAPSEQAGVESFVVEKRGERDSMQRVVIKALDRMEGRDLAMRFERIVEKATPRRYEPAESADPADAAAVQAE